MMHTLQLLDGTGYIAGDIGLATLISLAAVMSYARVAFEVGTLRMPVARLTMGFGFTLWALRFWYTIATDGDVIVAPMSMFAITLIAAGYSVVQLVAIRRAVLLERNPVFCLQEPSQRCQREDRIQEAMK